MHRSLLVAAIVASLGLAACSGGTSPAIPGSLITAQAGERASMQIVNGELPPASCPSQYIGCVTVAKGHPAKYQICITTTGNCTSGSFPKQKWSNKIVTLKGKAYKGITGSFKPNPGNPTEVTVTAKVTLKNSKGKVVYVQDLKACPTGGGKCSTGAVGIATK